MYCSRLKLALYFFISATRRKQCVTFNPYSQLFNPVNHVIFQRNTVGGGPTYSNQICHQKHVLTQFAMAKYCINFYTVGLSNPLILQRNGYPIGLKENERMNNNEIHLS